MDKFNQNGNGYYPDEGRPVPLRDLVQQMLVAQDKHIKQTERLFNIVLGDEEAKQDGLVHKVDSHRKYIEMDKRIKWTGLGMAGITGMGYGFMDYIKAFFIHFR
jgi:hypothetical protein